MLDISMPRLNNHDATCGILPHLKEQLEISKRFNFTQYLQFLSYQFQEKKAFPDMKIMTYDRVDTFIKANKEDKIGIFFLNAYDGLRWLNNEGDKFYSVYNTLRYLDFQIAKHLRRIKAQLEMGNDCSYCKHNLGSDYFIYSPSKSTEHDIVQLGRLRYKSFKDLTATIDFFVGLFVLFHEYIILLHSYRRL